MAMPKSGRSAPPFSIIERTRKPPAEKPMAPTRCGSTPWAAALARTQRSAARPSASASGGVSGGVRTPPGSPRMARATPSMKSCCFSGVGRVRYFST
jgi:hypothetical protein